MRSKEKFSVRARKVVFSKGPIHLVDCDVAMPSGRVLSRQILEHPGSVVIIPKIAKDRFILIRQFRFAARSWLWEFPAGGVEKGESLKKAASRELMEEIGYRPQRVRFLLKFYPTPGVSGEVMHLYLAEKLIPRWGRQDEDEEIEAHAFTAGQIERMIKQKKIIDAKTILGFYYLKNR